MATDREEREASLENAWLHGEALVLKFAGVDSISAAQELVGWDVCVPASERRSLEENEYFVDDLVGCEVFETGSGGRLGRVIAYQEAVAGSGLIELDNGVLIPFVRSICIDIDPAAGRIEVALPEGLKDLNAS